MTIRRSLVLALLSLFLLAMFAQARTYRDRYGSGVWYLNKGKYEKAIEEFRDLLKEDPDHELADDCQYRIGLSYYKLEQYEQALIEFDRAFAYPNSDQCEDALFMIANCHEKMGEPEPALEVYKRFVALYPEDRHAEDAREKIEELSPSEP